MHVYNIIIITTHTHTQREMTLTVYNIVGKDIHYLTLNIHTVVII